MAALYLSNDVRVFLEVSGGSYYELVVAPGFTFNQNSTSEDISAVTMPSTAIPQRMASNKVVEKIKRDSPQTTHIIAGHSHGITDG